MESDSGDTGMSRSTATHQSGNSGNEASAALVEVCSVRLGETWFGVPITHILEIVGSARPQPVPLAPGYVGGLVHYRGDVLTTVSLRQLLSLPPKDGTQDILVLEIRGRMLRPAGRLGGRGAHRLLQRPRAQSVHSRPTPQGPVRRRLQAQRQAAGHARSRAT